MATTKQPTTLDRIKQLTDSIPSVILSGDEAEVLKLRMRIEKLRNAVSAATKDFDERLTGLLFATPDAFPTLRALNDNNGAFRKRTREDLKKTPKAEDPDLLDF